MKRASTVRSIRRVALGSLAATMVACSSPGAPADTGIDAMPVDALAEATTDATEQHVPADVAVDHGSESDVTDSPVAADVHDADAADAGIARCDPARTPGADSTAGVDPASCAPPAACTGVMIDPSMSTAAIQSAIDSNPSGTTFCFHAGTYRLTQTWIPKDGDVLIAAAGTVLSGAAVVPMSAFTQSGSLWVANGQTQNLPSNGPGSCLSTSPLCLDPNDVYYDNRMLTQVGSMSAVTTGTYYFDHANDRFYIADDPTGHTVEATVQQNAIWGGSWGGTAANNVTVAGFVVEKFGTWAQRGAIDPLTGTGWLVTNNEVRLNHGLGLNASAGGRTRCNNVHHNGQMGAGGSGDAIVFEHNELAFNDLAGYDQGWEAGGCKFTNTDHLVVRSNYSHDNLGPGLWTDIDNIHVLYENNRVENNHDAGIFHEISYDALIQFNTVRANGLGFHVWLWGSGIQIAASQNVEVCGNLVDANGNAIGLIQQNRGTGAYGPRLVQNDSVHDNVVYLAGGDTGAVQDVSDDSIFTSRNNRFANDTYHLAAIDDANFCWMDHCVTHSGWTAYGQDTAGMFVTP